MHPGVIFKAHPARDLMRVKNTAQPDDHLIMARPTFGRSVGTGEETAFEALEVEVLLIRKRVGGMWPHKEPAQRSCVDVLMPHLGVISGKSEQQVLVGAQEGRGVEFALIPDEHYVSLWFQYAAELGTGLGCVEPMGSVVAWALPFTP
jgi:hypothetical protein